MQHSREEQERNAKAHLEMQQKQNQALMKELEIKMQQLLDSDGKLDKMDLHLQQMKVLEQKL